MACHHHRHPSPQVQKVHDLQNKWLICEKCIGPWHPASYCPNWGLIGEVSWRWKCCLSPGEIQGAIYKLNLWYQFYFFPFLHYRQEELQEFEVNPDVPTMRLYRCWDSKALISEDSQSRSITTEQRGEVTADQAAILMYWTQLLQHVYGWSQKDIYIYMIYI